MQAQRILLILLSLLSETFSLQHRYVFYRSMVTIEDETPTRRVFGGDRMTLSNYPAVCALLDRFWNLKCSGSIISKNWVLTAAHCVSNKVALIKYNTIHLKSKEGSIATVLYLYRHPNFQVLEEDEGRGVDVTVLRNDVGLVRTKQTMTLNTELPMDPIAAMLLYAPYDMKNQEIEVLGFGRTDKSDSSLGEELYGVKLKLVGCDRSTWTFCMCGTSVGLSGGRGVCSGDSGGPMTYNGSQIGVTSMGPIECATRTTPGPTAISVFTSLHEYASLISHTIDDTENALKMTRVP
ncbi:trypsin-like, partial [Hyposmocoma kahamanoa]|uniref:trypsin-like n=1 Tax=Hyposmocoma kahamanoa TaxID=1477025 RepID=UPI000E6D9804